MSFVRLSLAIFQCLCPVDITFCGKLDIIALFGNYIVRQVIGQEILMQHLGALGLVPTT